MAEEAKDAQKLKNEAYIATTRGIEDEAAALLKQKYKLIALVDPSLPAPPEDNNEYRRMARDLINKRETSIGGKNISLDEVNTKLKSTPEGQNVLKELGVENVHALVPTRDQVNRISQAVSDAVGENLSTNGTVTWGNWFNGLASGKEKVAQNFKSSTVTHLTNLKNSDPGLRNFLTEGKDGTIEQMGQAVYSNVMNPDARTADRVASTRTEEVDVAIRTSISDKIYTQTVEATQSGINAEIQKGYDSGFMGSLAKMLGPDMANALIGFINFFVRMFGGEEYSYIPSDREVQNVSHVVGSSVRNVFSGNEPPQTPEDAAKAVKKNVRSELEKNKEFYTSFSAKQLDEMAEKAGTGAKENFNSIPRVQTGNVAQAQAQAMDTAYQPANPEGYTRPATTGTRGPNQNGQTLIA